MFLKKFGSRFMYIRTKITVHIHIHNQLALTLMCFSTPAQAEQEVATGDVLQDESALNR